MSHPSDHSLFWKFVALISFFAALLAIFSFFTGITSFQQLSSFLGRNDSATLVPMYGAETENETRLTMFSEPVTKHVWIAIGFALLISFEIVLCALKVHLLGLERYRKRKNEGFLRFVDRYSGGVIFIPVLTITFLMMVRHVFLVPIDVESKLQLILTLTLLAFSPGCFLELD